jgi:ubiquinone/menaquinone biosynthesis C-methylase UbiE
VTTLNFAERLLIANPVRRAVQRFYEVPLLRSLGGRLGGKRALEIGCGPGAGTLLILREFGAAEVRAIDIDPRMVDLARARLRRLRPGRASVACGDASRIDEADESFDAVFDFGILHHVGEWRRAVGEIRRVLRPEGRFYFEEVTKEALDSALYRLLFDHPREDRFTTADFLSEIGRAGLQPVAPVRTTLFGQIFIGVARAGN